jgi:hypothetical protein
MALTVVRVDRFTQSELGRSGLEELSRNLWPGRCQTCGRELGTEPPAVVMVDEGLSVTASLHHAPCQRPRWTRIGVDPTARHLTISTRLVSVPYGDPARDPFLPTLLVNPGLEQVTLVRTDSGRYRATTVEDYRPLGLRPPEPHPRHSTADTVTSWLADDRLIVRCGDRFWVNPVGPVDSMLARSIQERGEVVLGISTALDPGAMTNPEPVKRILAAGDLATVSVPLNRDAPVPDLTGPTVALESDLAWADEHNDADWLPVTPFGGPTYDPATGLFRVGIGMDGPKHWRLTDRGVGAVNGLIAGQGGTGKSNVLRLVVVEAMYSAVFDVAVADPLDRNGVIGAVGKHAMRSAGTRADTISLLAWAAGQVEERRAEAGRWREPRPDRRGLLVAVDDAHEVFADPTAVDLATRVAIGGPVVGVGLVAVIESVGPDTVAGRRDLLLALGETNALLFDQRQLQLWSALRDG